MTQKITELGGGMASVGLTTKDTNDTKGGEACGHGMTLKITELGGGMARVGLTTKDTNDTKGGEACGHGMTLKITELGGGMASVGLTTKYAKDTKWGRGLRPRNDTEDHGIGRGNGARRFARESREYRECKDNDFGNIGARRF
jgi:hypothetical protein